MVTHLALGAQQGADTVGGDDTACDGEYALKGNDLLSFINKMIGYIFGICFGAWEGGRGAGPWDDIIIGPVALADWLILQTRATAPDAERFI